MEGRQRLDVGGHPRHVVVGREDRLRARHPRRAVPHAERRHDVADAQRRRGRRGARGRSPCRAPTASCCSARRASSARPAAASSTPSPARSSRRRRSRAPTSAARRSSPGRGGKRAAVLDEQGPELEGGEAADARRPASARCRSPGSQAGFLLDTAGRVWSTSNGGRSWKQSLSAGTSAISGISFGSSTSGYLSVEQLRRRRRRTPTSCTPATAASRGGRRRSRPASSARGGIVAADASKAFALVKARGGASASRQLFATASGGDAGVASPLKIKAKPVEVHAQDAEVDEGQGDDLGHARRRDRRRAGHDLGARRQRRRLDEPDRDRRAPTAARSRRRSTSRARRCSSPSGPATAGATERAPRR